MNWNKCSHNAARPLCIALAVFCLLPASLMAQDQTPVDVTGTQVATDQTPPAAANADALRSAAQNPIASLVSVPVQNIDNFGIGPANRTQNVVNIQPVIPLSLSSNWNLVVRWITPIIYQPIPVPQPPGAPAQITGVNGLGDMNPSFFLVPKKTGKIIWGVGPTVVLPTATNTTFLGQGKLSLGPSLVALIQPKGWTMGFLANNYWSVAGHSNSDKPAVNQFLLQWFVNYNMKKGWYLTTSPIITANWRAANNQWIVPFGGGVGRIMKMGFQPVNISAQLYGNAVHPPGASPWGLKLQIAFLFPKLTPQQQKMMLQKKLKEMDEAPPQK